jgi:transcriptional regulator with GAF, ATPase, and Fis domain
MRKRVSDSLAGQVLQTKRAMAIGNDSEWKRTHTALLVKSLIYVPLILQNKPIGVLGVTNRLKETSFDSNDTRALSALGGYATIAINNANIFKELESEKNTLSAIVDLTDDPIIVLEPGNELLIANSAAREALGLSPKNAMGQPIDKMIDADFTTFINQEEGVGSQITGEVKLQNGRFYNAEMTWVEGGNRSILLKAK